MKKSNGASNPVIIKKYANRRLYDLSSSSYVTLDHLSELVRKGVDFEVRDAKTGDDLTRQVLTQIIFEKENKGEGALPVNFLRKLISFYGGASNGLLPAWLEMSMNSFSDSQEQWARSMTPATNPFSLFEKQARANMEMFEQAVSLFNPGAAPKSGPKSSPEPEATPEPKSATPPDVDNEAVKILRAQMAAMQAQLDALDRKP